MGSYAADIAMAADLIGDAGGPIELVSFDEPVAYDPAKPWRPDSARASVQDTTGVFLSYAASLIDGTVIQQGDQRVLVAAAGLASPPTVDGEVRLAGQAWRIVRVETVAPDGTPILYTLQVRQ